MPAPEDALRGSDSVYSVQDIRGSMRFRCHRTQKATARSRRRCESSAAKVGYGSLPSLCQRLAYLLTTSFSLRIQDLEAEILALRSQHAVGLSVADGASSQGPSTALFQTPTRRQAPEEVRSTSASSKLPNPYALNPDDLDAPVTAIHAMTPETPRRHGGHDWDADQAIVLPSIAEPRDFLSQGALDETVARDLFNR